MIWRLLYRTRWFLLGFGLSGLHHDSMLLNLTFVIITAIALYEIIEGSEGIA